MKITLDEARSLLHSDPFARGEIAYVKPAGALVFNHHSTVADELTSPNGMLSLSKNDVCVIVDPVAAPYNPFQQEQSFLMMTQVICRHGLVWIVDINLGKKLRYEARRNFDGSRKRNKLV